MKALEKDRTRRYETANGFAADVLRYLSGEAVQAHPPSAGYRLKKFVRRHNGQVIAASFVLVTLLTGMAGTTFGLLRAQRSAEAEREAKLAAQADRETAVKATEAERVAKRAAQDANALTAERLRQIELINNTVFDIFAEFDIRKVKEGNDPVEAVLAQKLIEAGQKLDEKAIHDPLVMAGLQERLARSLLNLGHPSELADARGLWWKLAAGFVGLALLTQIFALTTARVPGALVLPENAVADQVTRTGAIAPLAGPLFHEYLLAFEVTSVLLLAAVVGAVVLGKRKERDYAR